MNKLIKNWAYLLVSDVSQAIITFFVFMFLARKLSPEGFGAFSTIIALASLFSIFSVNLSANMVVTREVTLHPEATNNLFRKVLPIRIFSLIATIISLIFYLYSSTENNGIIVFATSLIVASMLIWDLAESIAFGHLVTRLTTFISMGASLCWLIIVLLLPSKYINIEEATIIYAGILFTRSIIYGGFSFNLFIKPNRAPTSVDIKTILWMSMPYFWMRIVGAMGDQIPILLLKGFSGASEVGFYAVGNRFIMPITIAITTGLRAVFPFMTKTFQADKGKFNVKLVQSFSVVFIVGSSIATLLSLSSGFLLPAFFGEEYKKTILVFSYQAWFGVLLSFDLLLSTVLSSTYKQIILAILTTIDVLILFPLMYYGAKQGAEAMAAAKLIGAFISVAYHIIVVIYVLKIKINTSLFRFSSIYFLSLMTVSIFISSIPLKIMLIALIVILFIMYQKSQLRQILAIVMQQLAKKL